MRHQTASPGKFATVPSLFRNRGSWLSAVLSVCLIGSWGAQSKLTAQPTPAPTQEETKQPPENTEEPTEKEEPEEKTPEEDKRYFTGPKLPPGFKLPPKTPEVITLTKELLTQKDLDEFSKYRAQYQSKLRNGDRDAGSMDVIRKGLRYRILVLSMKENRQNLFTLKEALMREVKSAGSLLANERSRDQFRQTILKEVTKNAELLLDNNFYVRIQALAILGELNITEANITQRQEAEPYLDSADSLLKALEEPGQLDAVKVMAMKGLKRRLSERNLKPDIRLGTAQALVRESANPTKHYYYQMMVAEMLGLVGILYNRDASPKPIVAEALAKMLMDQKRSYPIRCMAARALGMAPLDSSINGTLIAHEIAKLLNDMNRVYVTQPDHYVWKDCYLSLYLAFLPANKEEKAKFYGLQTKVDKGKLGSAHATAVREVFNLVNPLTTTVYNGNRGVRLPADAVAEVDTWLKNAKPPEGPLAPGLDPITDAGTNPTQPVGVRNARQTGPEGE